MATTKGKLVSAAISLLEENPEGEAGLTMRAIAQRAGVGLGCANYHFGNKGRLLAACSVRLAERAMEQWKQAVQQDQTKNPLRLWGNCIFGMLRQAPGAFRCDGASRNYEPWERELWDVLFPPELQTLGGIATPVLLWTAMRGVLLDSGMIQTCLGCNCEQAEGREAFLDLFFSVIPGPGPSRQNHCEQERGR